MKVGTDYAAKKLGVSQNVVRKLASKGQLTDVGQTKKDHKRHEFVFERSEVVEFAKAHTRVGRKFIPKSTDVEPKRPAKVKPAPVATVEVKESTGTGKLFQRLDSIEEKLAKLLSVWGDE
jgi:hypothetical protein